MLTDEQKSQFAEMYLRRPTDSMMIVSKLLPIDTDPVLVLSLADELPNDPFVLAEIQRIKNTPMDKQDWIIEVKQKGIEAWNAGEYNAFFKSRQMIAEACGFIVKGGPRAESNDGKGQIEKLAQMVVSE